MMADEKDLLDEFVQNIPDELIEILYQRLEPEDVENGVKEALDALVEQRKAKKS